MTFELEHEGRYHRVQVDGADLISIEDQGDGTAYVILFAGPAEDAPIRWSGNVNITEGDTL